MTDSPKVECPNCLEVAGLKLPILSGAAWVDYFRCKECGNVWTSDKKAIERAPSPVLEP